MNIFPFVLVRYIMYYLGKHRDRLVTLWIRWKDTGQIGRVKHWG